MIYSQFFSIMDRKKKIKFVFTGSWILFDFITEQVKHKLN